MKPLEQMVTTVTRAVGERLGGTATADSDLVQTVVREVVATLAQHAGTETPGGTVHEQPGSADRTPHAPLQDNGDGTVTTGFGAILPRPNGEVTPQICVECVEQERRSNQNRGVVTVTGCNRKGVIAALTAEIADGGGDIQDVSQTLVADFFTLIFVVDLRELKSGFPEFKQRIEEAANNLGVQAVVMHEDVMRALQRV